MKNYELIGLRPCRAALRKAVCSPGILKRIKKIFRSYCQKRRNRSRGSKIIIYGVCNIQIINQFLDDVENVNIHPNPTKD